MDFEFSAAQAVDRGSRRLRRRQQGRHGEIVARRQLAGDEAGIDHPDTDATRRQVEVQAFGEVDQGRLARTVGERPRQAAIAGDAGKEGNAATGAEVAEDDRDQTQRGIEIDLDDVVGEAVGEVAGNALRWRYVLALPVDGKVYHVDFDDWMFLVGDKVMLNRSSMSKWGFHLGEVTLSFVKP